MTLERWGLSWLKQHDFVIFLYISTKLDGNVYILVFNGFVKFRAKNSNSQPKYQQKSQEKGTFYVHPLEE